MKLSLSKKILIWVLGGGLLVSSYALSHRFIHDRMEFSCSQIGCMAGESEAVAKNCGCGEVNILNLPCQGKLKCSSEKIDCRAGSYCKSFVPECIDLDDCQEVDLEAPPPIEGLEK